MERLLEISSEPLSPQLYYLVPGRLFPTVAMVCSRRQRYPGGIDQGRVSGLISDISGSYESVCINPTWKAARELLLKQQGLASTLPLDVPPLELLMAHLAMARCHLRLL